MKKSLIAAALTLLIAASLVPVSTPSEAGGRAGPCKPFCARNGTCAAC